MAEGKIIDDKHFKFEETYLENRKGSLAAFEDEREVRTKIWCDMTDGDVVIDVGSNYGQYTLAAASQVKPHGMVYSFESDPLYFKKLRNNIKINKWHDIISAHRSKLDDSVTIDKFISELSTPPTKLKWIKIDTDGTEYQVVKGALNTIKKYHPYLLIHCHGHGEWEQIYNLLPKPETAVSKIDTPVQDGQIILAKT